MPPAVRKYVALAVVVVGFVAVDYLSKRWAHDTLGSEDHPLPFVVTDAEAGQPVSSLVAAHFPDLDDPTLAAAELVRRVDRDVRPEPGQHPFAPVAKDGKRRVPLEYAVFHEGFDAAPRIVMLVEKPLLRRWLGFVLAEKPRAELDRLVADEFEGLTIERYLAGHIAGLDEAGAVAAIEEGRVLPLFTHRLGVVPEQPARAGDLYLLTERRVDVIPGFFRFDYKENPGAAWGLLASHGPEFRQYFLSGVSALAALVILIIFVRLGEDHWSAILAFAAILAGAVGNLIDRLQYNYVIDFFDMYISYMHWPTYNVADIAITLGVIALVFEMLFVKSSPFAQPRLLPVAADEGVAAENADTASDPDGVDAVPEKEGGV